MFVKETCRYIRSAILEGLTISQSLMVRVKNQVNARDWCCLDTYVQIPCHGMRPPYANLPRPMHQVASGLKVCSRLEVLQETLPLPQGCMQKPPNPFVRQVLWFLTL